MTIHDELILAITQPDKNGVVPLKEMIECVSMNVQIEPPAYYKNRTTGYEVHMTPDIVASCDRGTANRIHYVIELENDLQWDFASSLQQVKKYQRFARFKQGDSVEFVVIIPFIYKRYAPLYKNENIKTWFWSADRVWECMKCGHIFTDSRSIQPNCAGSKCNNRNVRLYGVNNLVLEEFDGHRRVEAKTFEK